MCSESDSRSFYDTAEVFAKCFHSDWGMTKIHKLVKDAATLQAAKNVLLTRYERNRLLTELTLTVYLHALLNIYRFSLIREIYRFFCASGDNIFEMSYAKYMAFISSCGIDAFVPLSPSETEEARVSSNTRVATNLAVSSTQQQRNAVIQNSFVAANYDAAHISSNPAQALTRHEFLEILVRLAVGLYRGTHTPVHVAVRILYPPHCHTTVA